MHIAQRTLIYYYNYKSLDANLHYKQKLKKFFAD